MTMISCSIIDDERRSIDQITKYINQVPFLELEHTNTYPDLGLQMVNDNKIDLIFLDIEMEGLNGLRLMEQTNAKIVFTTGHEEHAVKSFNHKNVLDYLLKPITFDRFLLAAQRVENYFQTTEAEPTTIRVKTAIGFKDINADEILYIQANKNYVKIHQVKDQILALMPLKDVATLLPDTFVQIHKSYIVNSKKIINKDAQAVMLPGLFLPFGRTYRKNL